MTLLEVMLQLKALVFMIDHIITAATALGPNCASIFLVLGCQSSATHAAGPFVINLNETGVVQQCIRILTIVKCDMDKIVVSYFDYIIFCDENASIWSLFYRTVLTDPVRNESALVKEMV